MSRFGRQLGLWLCCIETGSLAAVFPLAAAGVFAESAVAVERARGVAGTVSIDPAAAAVLEAMGFFFTGFGFFPGPVTVRFYGGWLTVLRYTVDSLQFTIDSN